MTSTTVCSPEKKQLDIPVQKKEIDDNWRRWIAENLILGHPSESIMNRMIESGFDDATTQIEVLNASHHPYVQAGILFTRKLKKRDWILDNYRLLEQSSSTFGLIERKYKLSREAFLNNYYTTNRPVIIQGALDDWKALSKWNPTWLKQRFGERLVEIQTNRNSDPLYEINMKQHQQQILFGDYMDMIMNNDSTNDFYMTANNTSKNMEALHELWDDVGMLPEYLDSQNKQKSFLWLGPAGTITPLHHDLTNNLMAQIYGRKLIKLIPAHHMPHIYNHLHCYSEVDMDNIDYERYPLFKNANIIELILEPGEILFLPVGCWHYVRGLDISITMSFTNFLFHNNFSSHYTTYNEI